MYSNIASSRPVVLGGALVLVIAGAVVLRAMESRLDALVAPHGVRSEQLASLSGRGGFLAALGGMRAMVAGGFWLRTNLAWERRDAAATTALLDLTVAADERPLYFWLNGARMLAYDMPEWRLAGPVPAAVRQMGSEAQAGLALRFLGKGLRWHGAESAFYIEMANIHLRRRGDLENAALCYRLAAERPEAPYYAARIYAELLRALGRSREALAWLRQILPNLPAGDPAARRDVVLERIEILERELAVP